MKDSYIALLDSGIGGISVLEKLINCLPKEKFLYFGDNKNAPYGNKNENQLLQLTIDNLTQILCHKVKSIVFACNTLSVRILPKINYVKYLKSTNKVADNTLLKKTCNVSFFGTYPPIEKAVKNKKKKTLLLCTCATEQFYKNQKVKLQNPNLEIIGFSNLVSDIEQNKFQLSRVDFSKHIYNECKKREITLNNFDNVILGCTHYHFIKNQIIDHFQPQKIFDGGTYTAKKVKKALKTHQLYKIDRKNQVIFIGDSKEENKNFYFKWLNDSFYK